MNKWLKDQHRKLKKQIQLLEQTEGFDLLTDYQKQFIINSLFLQAREQRYRKAKTAYQFSHQVFEKWFCHASVLALEEGLSNGYSKPNEKIPSSFFVDDLYLITSKKELKLFLLKAGFPSVVHVNGSQANFGRISHHHTCLSLGTDQSGNIVTWEKEGYGFPFQVANHKSLFDEYPNCFYSFRPLFPHNSPHSAQRHTPLLRRLLSYIGF